MPKGLAICVLSDAPQSPFAQHLSMLYPDRVTALNFTEADHSPEALKPYTHVVTMVSHRRNVDRLDYGAVRRFAQRGGNVASCLFEYAHDKGLHIAKTHLPEGPPPGLRIRAQSDITRGFALGDVTPWFGKVSGAPLNDQNPSQFYQRQIIGLEQSDTVTILGVSTVNAEAVLVEERVGKGRIMALDFLSLKEPFFDSWGSTNKYLFLGNLIGGSVRYGKHYPRKLPYDELVVEMRDLADRLPALTFSEEGACSDGRPMCSLSLGNPRKPGFLFMNGIHGWEWEAGYGLLHLAELLAGDDPPEGLSPRDFYLKVIPQLNPYGYDHDFRHNANGVDLNRNFDFAWDSYLGGDDSYQPWDFDYKGPSPASEPETRIVQDLIRRHKPTCLIDFHTAHYVLLKPHKGEGDLITAIHEEIKGRLKDRYLCQRPYSTQYQQVNVNDITDWQVPQPYLINYAAEAGVPAAFLLEMSGNRTDSQALVMNTDTVIEICLAAIRNCLHRRAIRGPKPAASRPRRAAKGGQR